MGHVTLKFTLMVTYELNGESVETMRLYLRRMANHAVDRGMLTGETDATVDQWACLIDVVPEHKGEARK